MLHALGPRWEMMPTFTGDEDAFYAWISEPSHWMRMVLPDNSICARVRQRFTQLHTSMLDALDSSGFVLWRSFPPRRQLTVTLKQAKVLPRRIQLPRVTFKQSKLQPSQRFRGEWSTRSLPARWASAPNAPDWVKQARALIEKSTFDFMGEPMSLVDARWCEDRFARSDAVLHALVNEEGRLAAAAVCSPFAPDRLLRALLSDKESDVLYIDVICAAERGAAYRLLCDIVDDYQAAKPDRRLVVVLMAVVSSAVLKCYSRWGFSYGGVVEKGHDEPSLVLDQLSCLQEELARFEYTAQIVRPSLTSFQNCKRRKTETG